MKQLLLFSALFLLTGGPLIAQCADPANIYGFTYNGKGYEVVKEMKTWAVAAACAVERGGYLAEINSSGEQEAIYDAILNGAGVSPTYTVVGNGGGIAYVWIGATDQAAEGTWLWDGNGDNAGLHFWSVQGANGAGNGSAVGGAYYHWGGSGTGTPNEPDNYGTGQHHAAIGLAGWPSGTTLLGSPGEWNDIIGSSPLYFVIELEGSSGLNTPPEKGNLQVIPNPATGMITVVVPGNFSAQRIILTDLSGKELLSVDRPAENRISLGGFTPGTYLLKASVKGVEMTAKVVRW